MAAKRVDSLINVKEMAQLLYFWWQWLPLKWESYLILNLKQDLSCRNIALHSRIQLEPVSDRQGQNMSYILV